MTPTLLSSPMESMLSLNASRRISSVLLAFIWAKALLVAGQAHAHGDEPHAEPASATNTQPMATPSGTARRMPDGSVRMPKQVQNALGVRTALARIQAHAPGINLRGQIVADPQAGGRVQASQAGRIEAGPQGLPTLGQAVKKGQILAYLHPTSSSLDRGNQQAMLADLEAQYTVAERKAQRYEQLDGVVPRKDIEAAKLERDALRKRKAAIAASMHTPESLVAPTSGTIASANAVLGQVVDAKDVLFEVVDTRRLLVEAVVYDPALATQLVSATASLPRRNGPEAQATQLNLKLIGAGRQLRDQALPLLFRIQSPPPGLVIGQVITVTAQTSTTFQGAAVPRQTLTRLANGNAVAWVLDGAEHFVPRPVQTQPLDAQRVIVTSGLHDGDHIVIEGATLLAQVR